MFKLIHIATSYQVMLADAVLKVLTKHFDSESVLAISVSLTVNFNVIHSNRVFSIKWVFVVIIMCGNTDIRIMHGRESKLICHEIIY